MIVETYQVSADDTDVLAAPSRLNSIPYNGTLIIEMQASANDATNNMTFTLQLPDGSTPAENVHIPKGATDGAWNTDDKYTVQFNVTQGGHVNLSIDETGTCVGYVRATLMP